jgi:hypothetical protein
LIDNLAGCKEACYLMLLLYVGLLASLMRTQEGSLFVS